MRGSWDSRQLEAVLESLPDAILIADDAGRFAGANAAACELVGRAREQLLDLFVGDLAGETGAVIEQTWRTLVERGSQHSEIRIMRPDGAVRIAEMRGTANVVPGLHMVVLRDLTEAQARVSLPASSGQVETLAMELAVALDQSRIETAERERAENELRRTQEQLRHAQKMEALGTLAGGVAHDFNNILTAILSFAELLLEDLPESDPRREYAEEIRHSGTSATQLTRQLLLFSRQQPSRTQTIQINDLVHGLEKMIRRLIGERIALRTELESSLPVTEVDPSHFEQVLMNLVVNAHDAMPEGGTLTIETRTMEVDIGYARQHLGVPPGRYVMLSVSDTGTGIEPDTRQRIFEPFFTTKGPGRGTGLGLSTAFGIVEQCHGTIWVYSEPGRGSTFKVLLPESTNEARPSKPPRLKALSPGGKERVLVVEDDLTVRRAITEILARLGYQVSAAADGKSALELLARSTETIDLLLTDLVMPGLEGREVAERARLLRPGLRVLYMSGYAPEAARQQYAMGANDDLLQKPIVPRALAQAVRQALDVPSPSAVSA